MSRRTSSEMACFDRVAYAFSELLLVGGWQRQERFRMEKIRIIYLDPSVRKLFGCFVFLHTHSCQCTVTFFPQGRRWQSEVFTPLTGIPKCFFFLTFYIRVSHGSAPSSFTEATSSPTHNHISSPWHLQHLLTHWKIILGEICTCSCLWFRCFVHFETS